MQKRRIAVIIGAGPGLGASLAQALSKTHSLLLLSRSLPESLPRLHLKIPEDQFIATTSDGSKQSIAAAMKQVEETWPGGVVDVGVVNTGGKWTPGHFLDQKVEDFDENFQSGPICAFNLAQTLIPLFLSNSSSTKGTLIFTGATLAMRGGANFSAMAPAMFARRCLSQSLAREFGPQAIHVAHVIVDGHIDPAKEGTTLRPQDIAQSYLNLIDQPRSAWTQELDLRPFMETF